MGAYIRETSNYSMFKPCLFNRDIRKIRKLQKSMKLHGFIDAYPLHCHKDTDGLLSIKAGHHRFESAKLLRIPVKYVICEDNATIHELESSTNPWNLDDYLTSHVRSGSVGYQKIKEYREKTKIPLTMCISMFSGDSAGSNNKKDAFKDGFLKITPEGEAHAEKVALISAKVRVFNESVGTNVYFIKALSRMLFVKQFSVSKFIEKVNSHSFLLQPQANLSGYSQLIESIYNRQNKNKVNLTFLADEAMKERSAV
jgi:hypothetical protein